MVKIFLILFLSSFNFLFALQSDVLDSTILNIVGENTYNRNKSFINKIFKNEPSFYKNGNLNIYKVISLLKDNGLLRFKFDKPQEFSAKFIAKTSPIFLLKSINRSLSYMGYSYFATSEASYENDISIIKISLLTEHIIDPIALLDELSKSGFFGINIKLNSPLEWEYTLSLVDSKIPDARFLSRGNSLDLNDVSGEYWLELSDSKGRLRITKYNNASFNPKIVFFDKNLNVLDVVLLSNRNVANIDVVNDCKFVQVSDYISSHNLGNGINIQFK